MTTLMGLKQGSWNIENNKINITTSNDTITQSYQMDIKLLKENNSSAIINILNTDILMNTRAEVEIDKIGTSVSLPVLTNTLLENKAFIIPSTMYGTEIYEFKENGQGNVLSSMTNSFQDINWSITPNNEINFTSSNDVTVPKLLKLERLSDSNDKALLGVIDSTMPENMTIKDADIEQIPNTPTLLTTTF